MRSFFPLVLFGLSVLHTSAQNSLSGIITGGGPGEPIAGATVYISDLKRGTTSDSSGNYQLTDIPSGIFLVEYRYLGYEAKIIKTEIKGSVKQDIHLTESHTELKDVLITGMSAATERKVNPVPSISIDQEKLKESVSGNIIDAISSNPGLSQISTGAGISKPVIRGLGFNRVLVLQNSIRQEGQQWGAEHGIEIDEYAISRVEIIKGPGSLAYGSDAMAGVINLLSPEPADKGVVNLTFTSAFHSNNLLQVNSLFNEGNKKDFYWNILGTRKIASDYFNKYDGKVFNSGYAETDGSGMVGISKKWGFVQINFSSFHQQLGIIEGNRDSLGNFTQTIPVNDTLLGEITYDNRSAPVYKIYTPSQKIDHDKVSLTGKLFRKNAIFQYTFGYQKNKRREYEWHTQNDSLVNNATIYQLLTSYTYDLNYHNHFSGWETTFGVNGMYQLGENKGEELIIPEYLLNDIGIYAITQQTFKKFFISGGLRYNYRKLSTTELFQDYDGNTVTQNDTNAVLKFTGLHKNYSALAYSAGLSYKIKEHLIVKANFAGGFRAPNLSELGSNGAHEGTFRYEIGNADLKPESSMQSDLSLLAETEHFSLDMSVFYNQISNFIFIHKLINSLNSDSIIIQEGEINYVYSYVQNDASLFGGEIAFDIHPHPYDWLHFENSFSLVYSQLSGMDDEMRYLPFTPSPRLQSEIRAEFHDVNKKIMKFYFSISYSYQFKQDRIFSAYNTETETSGYPLLHTGFGIDLKNKKGKKAFTFIFGGQNLMNTAYQNHLSRLKYLALNPATNRTGVFNMGRNFMFKIILPVSI